MGGVAPERMGLEGGGGVRRVGGGGCCIRVLGGMVMVVSGLMRKERRGLLMGQLRSPGHLDGVVRFVSLRAPLVREVKFVVGEGRCFGGLDAAGKSWRFMLTTIVFRVESVCSFS